MNPMNHFKCLSLVQILCIANAAQHWLCWVYCHFLSLWKLKFSNNLTSVSQWPSTDIFESYYSGLVTPQQLELTSSNKAAAAWASLLVSKCRAEAYGIPLSNIYLSNLFQTDFKLQCFYLIIPSIALIQCISWCKCAQDKWCAGGKWKTCQTRRGWSTGTNFCLGDRLLLTTGLF